MKGIAVVVDAYGPARRIPPLFAGKGLTCIHVQSTPEPLPRFLLPKFEDFASRVVHRGDINATVDAIRLEGKALNLPFKCLVAGIEAGVDLADALSEALELPSNGTALGRVRRDKYEMSERLRAQGVEAVRQCKSGDVEELVAWAHESGWPMIIKPVDSAGGDGVYVCKAENELRIAVDKLLGTVNLMGSLNENVLAQEWLQGTEYVVNSASCAGKHYTTDVWRSAKRYIEGRGFVYDNEELMPPDEAPQTELIAYIHSVLDALDIKFGPSHAELMLTDRGPVLIEVGARMSGSLNPELVDLCMGTNHLRLGMEAFIDPEKFEEARSETPKLSKFALLQILVSQRRGILQSTSFVDRLRELPCFHATTAAPKIGDEVRPTEDLKSSLGFLYLVADQKNDLFQDYDQASTIVEQAMSHLAEN